MARVLVCVIDCIRTRYVAVQERMNSLVPHWIQTTGSGRKPQSAIVVVVALLSQVVCLVRVVADFGTVAAAAIPRCQEYQG
jgi:hypothetical protein